jgi:hypothetical protein
MLMSSNEQSLRDARAYMNAIDQHIASLQAERAGLEKRIAALTEKVGDESLPCWTCTSPQAADARHWLGANQNAAAARSASGLPLNCCKIVRSETRSTIVSYA